MSASVLFMSMSLDGYIAGPNDGPDNPGDDGFDRLHEWAFTPGTYDVRTSGPAKEFNEWFNATGAVLAGRRTVEQSITGKVIITACRSSWSATGRQVSRWRTIRW
jgi:dihydrofolate reductase